MHERRQNATGSCRVRDAIPAPARRRGGHPAKRVFQAVRVEVNGENAHPLYMWLKQQKSGLMGSRIKWNFTKFLVDGSGKVRARFAPMTTPERIARDIAKLL